MLGPEHIQTVQNARSAMDVTMVGFDPSLGRDLFSVACRIDEVLRFAKNDIDWTGLKGLTILDLGCGSDEIMNQILKIKYPPFFCEMCSLRGAEVFGIDLGPATKPSYTHIMADLIPLIVEKRLKELSQLGGKKFDIIHSLGFIDRNFPDPQLSKSLEELQENGIINYAGDFINLIHTACLPLLKESGVIIIEEEPPLKNQQGTLVPIETAYP